MSILMVKLLKILLMAILNLLKIRNQPYKDFETHLATIFTEVRLKKLY